MLLSHYIEIGRETKDVDFLATDLEGSNQIIENTFHDICETKIDDGFVFSISIINPLEQPHMNYPGFRVTLNLVFADRMKDRIQVDVGVGDIVEPEIGLLELYHYKGKPIFEDSVSLQTYPVETIFAEKLETIISKGAANSRMKDYHDLILLCRKKSMIRIPKLKNDILKTFYNRNTGLVLPISFSNENLVLLQKLWAGHRRGLGNIAEILQIPIRISDLITEINEWLNDNIN